MNENANRSLNPDITALLNTTHNLHLSICSVFFYDSHTHSSPQMTSKPYWSPFASVWLCVFPFKIFKMFLLLVFTAEVCSEHMSVLQYTAMLCLLLAIKHLKDIICCIIHESLQKPPEMVYICRSALAHCKSTLHKHVINGFLLQKFNRWHWRVTYLSKHYKLYFLWGNMSKW